MRKMYFFVIAVLCFNSLEAQIISFSDTNFKAKLLQANTATDIARNSSYDQIKIDVNNDGEIQETEASLVHYLNVSNSSIANINGIEFFNNLESLNVAANQLTNLNLDIPTLISFSCQNNQLTSLILNLPMLDNIRCFNNQLTSLDLTSCVIMLSEVYVGNNQLSSIQFPPTVGLSHLDIRNNNFDGFDLTVAPPHISFAFGGNPNDTVLFPDYYFISGGISYSSSTATNLDLTNLKAFGDSFSSSSFYISNCPNLTSINFKNNVIYQQGTVTDVGEIITNFWPYQFYIGNCPNFNSVCCDEAEIVYFSSTSAIHTTNLLTVNSTCESFSAPSFEMDELVLSPNPATAILNISITDNKTVDSIAIYNPLGQLVSESLTSNSIDISNLKTGTYVIKVHSEVQIFTKRFIKQ